MAGREAAFGRLLPYRAQRDGEPRGIAARELERVMSQHVKEVG
jgi:hypothetical protein